MTDLANYSAFVFDGRGGGRSVAFSEIGADAPESGFVWVHLHRDDPDSEAWLDNAGLDPLVLEALAADETRPRCTTHGEGAVLVLRGVNLTPGAEPEDMISVRLWIERTRVVGVWVRPLAAIAELCESIERGHAPVSPGDLVARLALRLADKAEPTVAALNERIDDLEQGTPDAQSQRLRVKLARIRRTTIKLRRFMVPQRDALTTFEIEDLDWLSERDRSRLREAADRVTRLGEELDAIRDRAQVINDQIMDMRAEAMNQRMLVLSVVAAIFLPLGLVTGLLGINVGGIPGAGNRWGFWIVCALLAVVCAVQVWLFKRLKIMK